MPTKIGWTQETINPFHGCDKISPGCEFCYAEGMARRLAGRFGYPEDDPFSVVLEPDVLQNIHRWRNPRMVFLGSMGDILHPAVPDNYIQKILWTINQHPQHTFQVLTKRIERFAEMNLRLPQNMWLGVSVENQDYLWRIACLCEVHAAVRFVSFEPLLGSVESADLTQISWVIAGCESRQGRPGRHMETEWIREIRDKCQSNEIPFFLKQMEVNGKIIHEPELDGQQWLQMPEGIVLKKHEHQQDG